MRGGVEFAFQKVSVFGNNYVFVESRAEDNKATFHGIFILKHGILIYINGPLDFEKVRYLWW